MKRKLILGVIAVIASACVCENQFIENRMSYVDAEEAELQYLYDAVGRLTCITYPSGTRIQYVYDSNGNIKSTYIIKNSDNNGAEEDGMESVVRGTGYYKAGISTIFMNEIGSMHDTPRDKQAYKKFQKKTPVIKSLKATKTKKKYYLKIQIRKMSGLGNYRELGYEVKYATNKNFKKAKTLQLDKKGSVTGAKWKVKQGKQYWVKVRAYMKTRTGQTIYSKYSKVKKMKVSKS